MKDYDLEKKVKKKLLKRGISEKIILNNRGLIGAVIEESSEDKQLAEQVKSMRSCQKLYFKSRSPKALIDSKDLERMVDAYIEEHYGLNLFNN